MKKLLITLVVVVGLLVGADFGARAIAESMGAKTLAEQSDVSNPDIDIHGFPFLTQAIKGTYEHVTLSADDVMLGTVTTQATVDAYDVHYPLSDAIHGTTDNMTADRAVVALRTPTSTFSTLLKAPGVTLADRRPGSDPGQDVGHGGGQVRADHRRRIGLGEQGGTAPASRAPCRSPASTPPCCRLPSRRRRPGR